MYTHRHYMLTYDPPHTISVLLVLLQDVFLKFMDAYRNGDVNALRLLVASSLVGASTHLY